MLLHCSEVSGGVAICTTISGAKHITEVTLKAINTVLWKQQILEWDSVRTYISNSNAKIEVCKALR
jgi:hypothetical protein